MMQVISVNVGLPREVSWHGELVETGIFKEPLSGPVKVGRLNLEGDRQADLSVHGGPEKAVYAYPSEHYPFWQEALGTELPVAAFGENLTTTGVTERDLHIGDRLRIGTAEFIVTQPRTPATNSVSASAAATSSDAFRKAGAPVSICRWRRKVN